MASITFVNRVRYKACYMRFTSSTQKEVEHPEEEINHVLNFGISEETLDKESKPVSLVD